MMDEVGGSKKKRLRVRMRLRLRRRIEEKRWMRDEGRF